jgi:hypothetical protein
MTEDQNQAETTQLANKKLEEKFYQNDRLFGNAKNDPSLTETEAANIEMDKIFNEDNNYRQPIAEGSYVYTNQMVIEFNDEE